MKKIIAILIFAAFIWGCDEENNPLNGIADTDITAKNQLSKVLVKARDEYAPDSKLAAIYGRKTGIDGKIDFKEFTQAKGFFYIVQSDDKQGNEIYVPIYMAAPVKSPLSLQSMVELVKDTTARKGLLEALNLLSDVNINDNASFMDSDEVMDEFLASGGQSFIDTHGSADVDMYLFPSKALTVDGITNQADWIANFYNGASSLVLWYHSNSGTVTSFD